MTRPPREHRWDWVSVVGFKVSKDQPTTSTQRVGATVAPDQASTYMQRRAEAIARLPRSPQRPGERPARAQAAALPDDHPESHQWVVATEIPVRSSVARYADFRGSLRPDESVRVPVLEVYCAACRRAYGDAAETVCSAARAVKSGLKDHLPGGRPHERARRAPSARADRTLLQSRQRRANSRSASREAESRTSADGLAS